MKKLILLSLLLLILVSCGEDETVLTPVTQLTIKNQTSSVILDLISWTDGTGTKHYFGDDLVWDSVLNKYVNGMNPSSSSTRTVSSGNGFIYFWFTIGGSQRRTVDSISVTQGEQKTFTFYDNTQVILASMLTKSLSIGSDVSKIKDIK